MCSGMISDGLVKPVKQSNNFVMIRQIYKVNAGDGDEKVMENNQTILSQLRSLNEEWNLFKYLNK